MAVLPYTPAGSGLVPAPASLAEAARRAAMQLAADPSVTRGRTALEVDTTGVRGELALRLGKLFSLGIAGEFGWGKHAQRRIAAVISGSF